MNLILLSQEEWLSKGKPFKITLCDRRSIHMIEIMNVAKGDKIKIGLYGENIGKATVADITNQNLTLLVNPADVVQPPPEPSRIKLIIGLPRPKVARRIVRTATEFGVKSIHFINSYKVEKSYWSSPLLNDEKTHEQIILGLEQSMDTRIPKIHLHKRFKPFVEDTMPALINDSQTILAHPYPEDGNTLFTSLKMPSSKPPLWLVIGPEGGFIPYEVDKLVHAGCEVLSLGERIFRTEMVVPYLLGNLSGHYTGQVE